jgi:protein-disulfide isomerase/uncharacterized membrane protein
MSNKKTLTLNGMTGANSLHLIFSILSLFVTLYLTFHYFDVHFPESLAASSSLCDISSYFNCDTATFSVFSNVMGVPTSIIGLLIPLLFLLGNIFPSEGMERTNKFLSLLNIIGCVVLAVYSVAILKAICPMCFAYYLLSFGSFFLFWKKSELPFSPEPKSLILAAILAAIVTGSMYFYVQDKTEKQNLLSKSVIDQFFNLPQVGNPDIASPYQISPTGNASSPIQIAIFSDFQCPFCQKIAHQFEGLARRYKDKISIQYFFYPLDSKCNSEVKRAVHPHACEAAYIAACSPEKFLAVHDEIFKNQEIIDTAFLQNLEKKHGLNGCAENIDVQQQVFKLVKVGAGYNIKGTPTLIINGVKIETALPNAQLTALFDEIIKRAK